MEIWVLILSALCYIVAVSAQNDGGSDPFEDDRYQNTYSELQKCSIPSSKMFTRPVDSSSGKQHVSTFDAFCLYRGKVDNRARFMCLYYKQIIETYFKSYCEDDGPTNKPLDQTAQYLYFYNNPEEVYTYLASNLRAQGGQVVFETPEECLQFCQQTKQSIEFCTNFGFVLSTALSYDTSETEEENQQQGAGTSGVVGNPTGNTVEGMSKTDEGQQQVADPSGDVENPAENPVEETDENQQQGADAFTGPENPAGNTEEGDDLGDAANPYEENEPEVEDDVQDETQDNIDNGLPPFIGGEVPTNNITDEDFDETETNIELNDVAEVETSSASLPPSNFTRTTSASSTGSTESAFKGLDNEPEGNVDEYSDSYSSDENYEVQKGNEDNGGIFGDFNLEKPGDNFEEEKEEEEEQENNKVNQAVIPSLGDQKGDMNLLIEKERELLEEESSSHFLAYSLTAIILVMVTYILYHNKKKIVAVIVEGRHNGQGKRRRYNQNVSDVMPSLKSTKLAV